MADGLVKCTQHKDFTITQSSEEQVKGDFPTRRRSLEGFLTCSCLLFLGQPKHIVIGLFYMINRW